MMMRASMEEKHYCTETTHQTDRHSGVVRCSSLTPCLLVCLPPIIFGSGLAALLRARIGLQQLLRRARVCDGHRQDRPPSPS